MSVQQRAAAALDVSPAATFPPWQQVSKKVWVGREGDKRQVTFCGGFPSVHGKFSCWKWRMGVPHRAAHGGVIGDPESTLTQPGEEGDGWAGPKRRGGSKGVWFSARVYFVPLLIKVGMAILWCNGKNAGLSPARSVFWSEVNNMNIRNDLIMVLHECNWKADLLL